SNFSITQQSFSCIGCNSEINSWHKAFISIFPVLVLDRIQKLTSPSSYLVHSLPNSRLNSFGTKPLPIRRNSTVRVFSILSLQDSRSASPAGPVQSLISRTSGARPGPLPIDGDPGFGD